MSMRTSVTVKNRDVRLTIDARKVWDGGIGRYIRGLVVGLMGLPEFAPGDQPPRRWRLTVLMGSDAPVPPEWLEFLGASLADSSQGDAVSDSRLGNSADPNIKVSDREATNPNCTLQTSASPLGEQVVNQIQPACAARLNIIRCDLARYSLGELLSFPAGQSDLVHIPHFTLPLYLSCPAVVTIHDLIHLEAPQRWYYPLIAYPLLAHAVRGAKEIITVSSASRDAILKRFPISKGKVTVVPNPLLNFSYAGGKSKVGDNKCNSSSAITVSDVTALETVTCLDGGTQTDIPASSIASKNSSTETSSLPRGGFLLAVFSTNKPHKRFNELLKAYDLAIKSATGLPLLPLCICGQGLSSLSDRSEPSLPPGVINLGVVSEPELQQAYARARAVVIPSAIEGFGFAVVEAHRHGTPVIMTPVPALKELAEPGDTVLPDFSEAAMAAALINASRHPKTKTTADLSRFNPQDVARLTMEVYARALGGI